MRQIVLIAHNLRSCHNVGSLLRTAEGLGVETVYLTGFTPYPPRPDDVRMPHEVAKLAKQIHKTALGAEELMDWRYRDDPLAVIGQLQQDGYDVCALEQTDKSQALNLYEPPKKVAILVGREVEGVEAHILKACSRVLQIPMHGQKESFNVVQAAAMALYHCRFYGIND